MLQQDRMPAWFYPHGPRLIYILVVALGVALLTAFAAIEGRQAQDRADTFRNAPDCVGPGQGGQRGYVIEKATVLDAWYVIGRARPPGIQVQRADGTVETIYFPANDQSIISAVSRGATVELQTWDGQVTQVRANSVAARPAQNPLADAENWDSGVRIGVRFVPFLLLIAGVLAFRQWLVYRALTAPWP